MLQQNFNKPNWGDNLQMGKCEKAQIPKINKTNRRRGFNVSETTKIWQCIGKGGRLGSSTKHNALQFIKGWAFIEKENLLIFEVMNSYSDP